MEAEDDPVKGRVLQQIRDLWIALANESGNMSAENLASEIEKLERVQRGMLAD
jgi:hypothetical protein